jgi:leucyl aminopeptidase
MKMPTLAATLLLALLPANAANAAPRPIDFAPAERPTTGMLVLPVAKDGALAGLAEQVDRTANGAIAAAIRLAKFKGDAGQTLTLYGVGPFPAVLLIGTGAALTSAADLRTYGALAATGTADWPTIAKVVVPDAQDVARDAVEAALGARLGEYDFGKWGATKPATEPAASPGGLTFLTPQTAATKAAFLRDGEAIAAGVTFARDLISTPSNIKTPEWFAAQVRQKFNGMPGITVTVLDETQIAAIGMGALFGTGQGSARPPRLVAIEYRGGKANEPPLAFVGKGITFDTGGISLKPNDGMWRMRSDMSGAAAAAGTVLTLARREAKVNAVAVLALAENMPDGNAIRPGDVLTSMSGKTIEVLNTDAEGRLVLADALWWLQQNHKPKLAVTIATLTGAVVGALGREHAGLFTMNDALATKFLDAGKASGELLWRLPVTAANIKAIKSDIADVKNIADAGAAPGASVGAAFIMEWAQPETPFVHIDIAGMAWELNGRPTEPKGAVGFGVRLFDEVARRHQSD